MDLLSKCRRAFEAIVKVMADRNVSPAEKVRLAHDVARAMHHEVAEFQQRMREGANDNGEPKSPH